ncbi:phosphoribosylformylglycinamidine cyclo-ligase [Facklamia miroungae]|uniref:Phosphoribosylformylglycinamidine cyclo-ligase n=1 Tax=Facklamia miroungae TaxID=120956 RepID=A0A1G7P5I1_9LACT|nr:phosphoribosylformylglycinamidine cyclo-ligase [Facklamia miroungae]NKZ28589.1 phosphoribosylformylglycinamidine cyclo-ligase [Facklamia miroungae]SDF81555.1 phosphoribosylformylglycinamidine cyclo-ligase [Facklamia miroungae]
MTNKNAYSRAGVDVHAGYEAVKRMKKHVERTMRPEVLTNLGGFGGAFDISQFAYQEPVLVSGTDGVGTKLMIAIQAEKYDTIGIDCVAMCVNDVVAQGAEPLFFLDYIAVGKNDPQIVEQIVAGVAEGCVQAGAALVGGETAEMPGMYDEQDFDVAGFTVGIAEKTQLITGDQVKAGDVLIGLASSGIHSNGFSLVRDIFFNQHHYQLSDPVIEGADQSLAEALLVPTKIYVKSVMPLVKAGLIHGIAHITGGGFIENLPRMMKENLACEINLGSWPVLSIFNQMQALGQINPLEMYEIFNMGIGMVLAVPAEKVVEVKQMLDQAGEAAYEIGQVIKKTDKEVIFK